VSDVSENFARNSAYWARNTVSSATKPKSKYSQRPENGFVTDLLQRFMSDQCSSQSDTDNEFCPFVAELKFGILRLCSMVVFEMSFGRRGISAGCQQLTDYFTGQMETRQRHLPVD
jgi:hypothetical protein